MQEEEIERFGVETEHGDHYTLSLIQEYRLVSTMSGGRQRIAGFRRYDVGGGGHANCIDELRAD